MCHGSMRREFRAGLSAQITFCVVLAAILGAVIGSGTAYALRTNLGMPHAELWTAACLFWTSLLALVVIALDGRGVFQKIVVTPDGLERWRWGRCINAVRFEDIKRVRLRSLRHVAWLRIDTASGGIGCTNCLGSFPLICEALVEKIPERFPQLTQTGVKTMRTPGKPARIQFIALFVLVILGMAWWSNGGNPMLRGTLWCALFATGLVALVRVNSLPTHLDGKNIRRGRSSGEDDIDLTQSQTRGSYREPVGRFFACLQTPLGLTFRLTCHRQRGRSRT